MIIESAEHARQLIADAGITANNVTNNQVEILWRKLAFRLEESGSYQGSYSMNPLNDYRFMTCRTNEWDDREAVSFNNDGFIGFAGWSSTKNIRPILDSVSDWLEHIKQE